MVGLTKELTGRIARSNLLDRPLHELPLLGVDPHAAPRARAGETLEEGPAPAFGGAEADALGEVERLLGPSPISLDDLADVAGLPLRQVRMAVTMLDLAGRIEHSGGDRVALLPRI